MVLQGLPSPTPSREREVLDTSHDARAGTEESVRVERVEWPVCPRTRPEETPGTRNSDLVSDVPFDGRMYCGTYGTRNVGRLSGSECEWAEKPSVLYSGDIEDVSTSVVVILESRNLVARCRPGGVPGEWNGPHDPQGSLYFGFPIYPIYVSL